MDLKKELVEELKKKGINIAEDAVMHLIDAVFEIGERAVVASENKYDDLLLAAFPAGKKALKDLADKIDGEKDIE